MKIGLVLLGMFSLVVLWTHGVVTDAAEVKVLCASAMRPVMKELGPQFERATGHQLTIY